MNKALIQQMTLAAAKRYGIDPNLFYNQINQESRFNPAAVSSAGALGPGQIMPATWESPGFGLSFSGSIDNPYDNLDASAQYMQAMLKRYGGDTRKALAAYNWGAGNADGWSGDMSALPKETQGYLTNILGAGAAPVMSLMDDADRNSPVTLADTPAEEEKGITFDPSMALRSLGAALTATARGEDASGQIGALRKQYMDEQAAKMEAAAIERARQAAMVMVGPDSVYGQALANGADVDTVMAQYSNEQARIHDFEVEGARNQNAINMQDRGFANDASVRAEERSIAEQERKAAIDLVGADSVYGKALANGAGVNVVMDQYIADSNRTDRRAEADQAQANWEAEFDAKKAQYDAEVQSGGNAGAVAKEMIASALDNEGNTQLASQVRNSPDTAFSDSSMVGQISDMLKSGVAPSAALQRLNEYSALDDEGKKLWREINGKGDTVINLNPEVSKLSNDTGYVLDPATGQPVIDPETGLMQAAVIPGSILDMEQKAAAADAKRAADAAMDNNLAKGSHVLRSLNQAYEDTGFLSAGLGGQLTGWVAGTPAANLKATLAPALSNIGFDRLSEMRAESKTGGALGSVTENELSMLQSTIASLETSQSPEQLRENIDYVRKRYTSVVKKIMETGDPARRAEALALLGVDPGGLDDTPPGDGPWAPPGGYSEDGSFSVGGTVLKKVN